MAFSLSASIDGLGTDRLTMHKLKVATEVRRMKNVLVGGMRNSKLHGF
jgi:hypothetical protein